MRLDTGITKLMRYVFTRMIYTGCICHDVSTRIAKLIRMSAWTHRQKATWRRPRPKNLRECLSRVSKFEIRYQAKHPQTPSSTMVSCKAYNVEMTLSQGTPSIFVYVTKRDKYPSLSSTASHLASLHGQNGSTPPNRASRNDFLRTLTPRCPPLAESFHALARHNCRIYETPATPLLPSDGRP